MSYAAQCTCPIFETQCSTIKLLAYRCIRRCDKELTCNVNLSISLVFNCTWFKFWYRVSGFVLFGYPCCLLCCCSHCFYLFHCLTTRNSNNLFGLSTKSSYEVVPCLLPVVSLSDHAIRDENQSYWQRRSFAPHLNWFPSRGSLALPFSMVYVLL